MVGKTAKRLTADDIMHTVFDQSDHFTGEQPSLSHLGPAVDDSFAVFDNLLKGIRCTEGSLLLYCRNGFFLHILNQLIRHLNEAVALFITPVVRVIDQRVFKAVKTKVKNTADNGLTALTNQEVLQLVIAQRGILHINLTDDSHLNFRLLASRQSRKIMQHFLIIMLHSHIGQGIKLRGDRIDPCGYQCICTALFQFIRLALIFDPHQHISV